MLRPSSPDNRIAGESKPETYRRLVAQATALVEGVDDAVANAANLSALIFMSLPDLNWAGFYRLKHGRLVLGPFQGKPACVHIEVGRGVCGTAVTAGKTLVVTDVHSFPGHIACDSASSSEIVVPLVYQGKVMGVLDLDSPLPGRFDDDDRDGLEAITEVFIESLAQRKSSSVEF